MVAKSGLPHIHFSQRGEGPAVILLHGLFGSGSNLGALARALAPDHTVFSLDLPNHGRSGWLENMSLDLMAQSVAAWMGSQGLASAEFVGHSLGGKVAMELALAQPALVDALVVADIAPVEYPPHHDAVFAALLSVHESQCESREEAAALMAEHIEEEGVIQFLLASLARGDGGRYDWRFNLEGLSRDYSAARAAPDSGAAFTGPVLFVKGGNSDYILPEHRERVLALFPSAEVKVMPGCGHWLHAEQPTVFNGIVSRFLARARSGSE